MFRVRFLAVVLVTCLWSATEAQAQVCGDGVVDSGEGCDDGNLDAGDGCDGTCAVEDRHECVGSPSECFQVQIDCGEMITTPGKHVVLGHDLVDCAGTSPYDAAVMLFADDITFDCDGHTIDGTGSDGNPVDGAGIFVWNFGVYPARRNNVTITNCTFTDYERAVFVRATDGFSLTDTTIDGLSPGVGVEVWASSDATLSDNTFDGAAHAIVVRGGQTDGGSTEDGLIQYNDVANGSFGVELLGSSTSYDVSGFVVDGNTLAADGGSIGIHLNYQDSATVSDNTVGGYAVGINAQHQQSPSTMSGNTACDNTLYDVYDRFSDGHVWEGNICDTAYYPASCAYSCDSGGPSCGDGTVAADEACDDGNTTAGDGCDGDCNVEAGWDCSGEPSVCDLLCGNGVLDSGEACDDGNLVDGDCCSATCTFETGGEQSCGVGECLNVEPLCFEGEPLECFPLVPPEPVEVTCDDGADNDCDGLTDLDDLDCPARDVLITASLRTSHGLEGAVGALVGMYDVTDPCVAAHRPDNEAIRAHCGPPTHACTAEASTPAMAACTVRLPPRLLTYCLGTMSDGAEGTLVAGHDTGRDVRCQLVFYD